MMAMMIDDNITLDALLDCNVTMVASVYDAQQNSSSVNNGLFLYRYIMNVIIMTPILALGIIANVIAFVVLCRQTQRLTTTVLLQGLAVADTLILVISMLRCIYVSYTNGVRSDYKSPYVIAYETCWEYTYMLMYFVRLTDTWLTILLTIDRYIAVCRPLQAQRICTLVRTYRHMTIVVVVSFFLSLPRLFEFKKKDGDFVLNSTAYLYIYRIGAFSFFMYLVPMTLLTVLNTKLICELRRANRFREFVRHSSHSEHQVPAAKKSVTVIVVTVVLVCIACNMTAFTGHLLFTLHVFTRGHAHLDKVRRYWSNISNLMVAVNSAVNFFIYYMCSRNFRTELAGFFRCHLTPNARRWRNHSSTGSLPVDTLMMQLSVCSGCGNRDSTLTSRSFCQNCRNSGVNNSLSRRL